MKLEVGMYVRTCNGTIFKIVGGNEDKWYIDISYSCLSRLEDEDYTSYSYNKNNSFFKGLAKRTSHNLIDLIKAGDYVNGLLVTRICVDEETEKKYLNMYGSLSEWENEDIKSIVTKEQFNSVKYEVE